MDINIEKPKVGQKVFYSKNHRYFDWFKNLDKLEFELVGCVTRVDDGICYYKKLDGEHNCFVWAFNEKLNEFNKLHRWQ